MARVHAELSGFATGVQGSVRVVAAPSVLAEELAGDIGNFLRQHPAVRVSLDERASPDIVRAVRVGAAKVGVLWDATDLAGLPLEATDGHACMGPTGHRAADRPLGRAALPHRHAQRRQHRGGQAAAGAALAQPDRHGGLTRGHLDWRPSP
jgi:DNA-binding transcriptional LysR family regulator